MDVTFLIILLSKVTLDKFLNLFLLDISIEQLSLAVRLSNLDRSLTIFVFDGFIKNEWITLLIGREYHLRLLLLVIEDALRPIVNDLRET